MDSRKVATNGQFTKSLVDRFAFRAQQYAPGVPGQTKDEALAGYLMKALKDGAERPVLAQAIEEFFDLQVAQKRSKFPMWQQLLSQMPSLVTDLLDRQHEQPREQTKTYGSMPRHLIEEIYGDVRAD